MSEWRERANRRRDERQTKIPTIRPAAVSKKDTKKWCRGKVGVEHKPVCVAYDSWKKRALAPEWRLLVCSECKKQLDIYWPAHKDLESLLPERYRRNPPAWVTS